MVNLLVIPLSMLPLVLAAVLGPIAYELYYLGYATSKNRLQIQNHNWKNNMCDYGTVTGEGMGDKGRTRSPMHGFAGLAGQCFRIVLA